MSIIAEAHVVEMARWVTWTLALVPVLALALAAWLGVFSKRTLLGPKRVDDGESLGVLMLIMGVGFMIWISVPALVVLRGGGTSGPVSETAKVPATGPGIVVTTRPATVATTGASTGEVAVSLEYQMRLVKASILSALLTGGFLVLGNGLARRNGVRLLGVSFGQMGAGVWSGVVGSLVMVPLVFGVSELTELFWNAVGYEHPHEHELLKLMGSGLSRVEMGLLIGAAVLAAPVIEELFFRGHLQTLVCYAVWRWRGDGRETGVHPYEGPVLEGAAVEGESAGVGARWMGILVASLLFAVMHPMWSWPPIFFLSVCVGYAYERTGNLWTTITMHAVFNLSSTLIYLFLVR